MSGWGRFPKIEARIDYPPDLSDLANIIEAGNGSIIPMGMARSYGDSALSNHIINTRHLDHLIAFDDINGTLTCFAGATLADILDVIVPKGWFLPVTPGTKFVSIGGAIASDVHGKNHHLEGSFCDHLTTIKILTVSDGIVECSSSLNQELFRATCGGMGLTGMIIEATFKLKPIKNNRINASTFKSRNLEHTLALFKQHQSATYSVAWIDCLATGEALGRSLVSIGEHADHGNNSSRPGGAKLAIPVNMPGWLLNEYSIKGFNALYYHRVHKDAASSTNHYDPFFYPLDSIKNWNRLYGKAGFIQYQLVLPEESSLEGLTTIRSKISASGKGSFLAVLKAFGPANENLFSFPMKGLTLALDFKMEKDLLPFLSQLDRIVLEMGGRIYLAKDARLSEQAFKQCYPQWEQFQLIREKYHAHSKFNSLQSQRLGL